MRVKTSRKHDLPDFTEKLKICIVSAPYYKDITENLIRGALNVLKRIKADIKAPAIGSSLKKLTILVPSGWGTPLIVAAPHPKILVPIKYSIKISIIKILRIVVQVFKSFFSFSK